MGVIPIKYFLTQQLAPPSTIKGRLEGRYTLWTQDGACVRYPACIPNQTVRVTPPRPPLSPIKPVIPSRPQFSLPVS
ncbi:hypothetical protein PoB_005111500 [Plakobranchus ocellatus]|uniref:Uncharacterized protein n=1 Tax=Plakobranchus ocellatus TaxID=259542 RepID=A0AAV4BVX4_9GAST|nr:hypothetical protein PoB_005111500 [Plakobranchus ocellatus]